MQTPGIDITDGAFHVSRWAPGAEVRSEVERLLADALQQGCDALDEIDAKSILHHLGIRVPRGLRFDPALTPQGDLDQLTPPYAVKALSNVALHKSDIGAVRLQLSDRQALTEAMRDIAGRMEAAGVPLTGYLVEEMCPAGTELVTGGTVDPQLGPMIMIGAGGIYAEILQDVSFRLCPIAVDDARQMIDELKIAPILKGARGRDAVDIDAIVHVLMALGGEGGFFTQYADRVAEFDINPLIVRPDGPVAVDGRIIIRKPAE